MGIGKAPEEDQSALQLIESQESPNLDISSSKLIYSSIRFLDQSTEPSSPTFVRSWILPHLQRLIIVGLISIG
jgi:hypothetical protein